MNSKRVLVLAGLGIVAGVVAAGVIYFKPPLATVGDTTITKKDAEYRDQIVVLSNPEEKRALGLFQLIKSAINYEILKAHGFKISEADLEQEKERIDKNTKDPEYLKKVKDIFGSNHDAYMRNFIRPNFVDQAIYYKLFLNDEGIQKESLTAANEFIASVKDKPKMFKYIAEQKKVLVRSLTLSLSKGMLWEESEKIKPKSDGTDGEKKETMAGGKIIDQSQKKSKVAAQVEAEFAAAQSTVDEAKKWHELVVQHMKPHEISPLPLNRQEEWLVLHLVEQKSKEEFKLEVAFFKKLDFSQWYENEKAKIPVIVSDSSYLVPK